MKTIVKGLIGLQDLSLGTGTFQRSTSTGGTQTMQQIPIGTDTDGSFLISKLNSVLYVGASLAAIWGSSDIGAQINAAYLSLPATGGTICVLPNTNGAAYSYSIPIVFGIVGKYVKLLGIAPNSQSGTPEAGTMGGSTLIFTPRTSLVNLVLTSVANADGTTGLAVYTGTITGGASNALAGKTFQVTGFATNMANNGWYVCTASSLTTLTLANSFAVAETHAAVANQTIAAITWANDGGSGGDAFVPGNIMESITLANAATFVTGGNYGTTSGSAAVGIEFTKAGRLSTRNVKIVGFGIGRQSITSINWGAKDYDLTISHCGVSSIWHDCQEDYGWFGGACIVNGRGEQVSGSIGVPFDGKYHGVSFDSNGSVGTVGNLTATGYGLSFCSMAGSLSFAAPTFTDCHFENLISGDASGAAPPTYIYIGNGTLAIMGGIASNDNSSTQPTGYTAPYWFSVNGTYGGSVMSVYGLTLVGSTQGNTCIFQVNGSGAVLQGSFGTPSPTITALIAGTNSAKAVNLYTPSTMVGMSVYQSLQTAVLTNGTAVVIGANPFKRGIALLTNESIGGVALLVCDSTGSITVLGASGGCTFQTGAAAGNQVQVAQNGTPQLTIKGTSTNVGQLVSFTQLFNLDN